VGNEENEHRAPDSKRTMISITNELMMSTRKISNLEIMDELIEILMEKLQEMTKQNVQNELKQYQDILNKKLEKTQKQLNELREGFNKHQSERKKIIKKKRERNEIKKTMQNMKKELNKYGKPQNKGSSEIWK
jgi:DNA repair ATPase RecN